MQRTFVYKLKPTAAQAAGLVRYLNVTRDIYNAALEQRITAWREHGESRGWVAQSTEIKELRDAGLLKGCHVHAVQLTLKRLDLAYAAFFTRHRTGKRGGFPRFKGTRYWRSFAFKEHGNGWRIHPANKRLRITAVGMVRVRLHRPLRGEPKTLLVVRKADGWYAHITCDIPAPAGAERRACARGTIEQPGRNVRQKAGLNRGIHNQAWGEFLELLDYKLDGGLVRVDPRGTSQLCSGCGIKVSKPLSQRWHRCPACGLGLHRDHNAALNIYQRAWAAPAAEAA